MSTPTRSARRSTRRARIRLSSIDQDQAFSFRAQAADIQARGIKEAEPELEKLARSGYQTVVTFARRGEGERFAYNLGRVDVAWLDGPARPEQPAAPSGRALDQPGPSAARAGVHRAPVPPGGDPRASPAAPPPLRRRRDPSAAGACSEASPTCGPATSSSTRTTGSHASPGSRPGPSPTSRATICIWSTPGPTACSSRLTSWRRSAATSAPAASIRPCRSWGARAGSG